MIYLNSYFGSLFDNSKSVFLEPPIKEASSMSRRHPLSWIAAAVATVLAAGPIRAQDAGSVSQGHAFALRVCAECHAVEKTQSRSRNSDAPRFEAIAKTPGVTSIALSAALQTSHRTMPNLILADDELRDVIVYILSLK